MIMYRELLTLHKSNHFFKELYESIENRNSDSIINYNDNNIDGLSCKKSNKEVINKVFSRELSNLYRSNDFFKGLYDSMENQNLVKMDIDMNQNLDSKIINNKNVISCKQSNKSVKKTYISNKLKKLQKSNNFFKGLYESMENQNLDSKINNNDISSKHSNEEPVKKTSISHELKRLQKNADFFKGLYDSMENQKNIEKATDIVTPKTIKRKLNHRHYSKKDSKRNNIEYNPEDKEEDEDYDPFPPCCICCKADDLSVLFYCCDCCRYFHNYCIGETDDEDDEWRCPDCSRLPGCSICLLDTHPEFCILCEGSCGRGFHIFCLSPPLPSVPSGNWYCPDCGERIKGTCARLCGIIPETWNRLKNRVKHSANKQANKIIYLEKRTIHDHKESIREKRLSQRHISSIFGSQTEKLVNQKIGRFQLERSKIHDWGVFSRCFIKEGSPVIEYIGQLIGNNVAEKREKQYESERVNSTYFFRIDNDVIIDATRRANIARFINHSCDPNCEPRRVRHGGKGKIVLFALRDIKDNEELTYDYNLPIEEEGKKIPCFCGFHII